MALEEFADNRKTKVTAFSLPPNIIQRLDKATASGEYGGKSAIVVQALTEFFAREGDCEDERVRLIIKDFLHSAEGQALIRSILRKSLATNEEKAAATPVIEKQ